MNNNKKKIKYYLKVINQIEKIRSKNNINWMNILRVAFEHSPSQSKKIVKKINLDDKRISKLFKKLSK